MHETKVLDLVRKLFAQSESEDLLGNSGAASLFAEKAQKLLIDYKLSMSDVQLKTLDFDNPMDNLSIIPEQADLTNARMLWFEQLAKVIAEGNFCKIALQTWNGGVVFYGRSSDVQVCSFLFVKLARIADNLCKKEKAKAKKDVGRPRSMNMVTKQIVEYPQVWIGNKVFNDSFHLGFRVAIKERYDKQRSNYDAVSSTALVLRKSDDAVNDYMSSFNFRNTKALSSYSDRSSSAYTSGLRHGNKVSLSANVMSKAKAQKAIA